LQIFIYGLSLDDLVHFVLSHSEIILVGSPAEGSVTLLIVLSVFAAVVVRKGKVCITARVLVAAVFDTNVVPSPECWTIIWIITNCISLISLDECHFLPEIELQQEGVAGRVSNFFTDRCPFERSVGGNGLAELSANDGKSIRNVVAELMEFGSLKAVLRGTK
jgi:hypothetical protein